MWGAIPTALGPHEDSCGRMGTMGIHPDCFRALYAGRPAAAVCCCPLLLSAGASELWAPVMEPNRMVPPRRACMSLLIGVA